LQSEAQPVAQRAWTSGVEAMDFTRGASAPAFGQRAYKEWHHFVVFAEDLEVLVNFSLCDRLAADGGQLCEQPRLVCFVRHRGRWLGDIENFSLDEAAVERGRIHFDLGDNHLEYRDGSYRIRAALRSHSISLDLELTARTRPVFIPSTSMHDGPPLHWCVIPRMQARGTVVVEGETLVVDSPAYHDHNWGHFLWGHDLSWEWGFILPDDPSVPWCVVFVRLTNRSRTTALNHNLLLWRDDMLLRAFHEGQIVTHISPRPFRTGAVFQAPRAAAMLAPGRAFDLPETFDDEVSLVCTPYDVARVMIPSETDLGLTIFNEVSSRVVVHGRVGGERIEFSGRSMMELIRHV